MARFSVVMVCLSAILWFVSGPPVYLGTEFPNCISAKLETPWFVAGALSINGHNCVFVDRWYIDTRGTSAWTERHDSHFCQFPVPPYGFGQEPQGPTAVVSATTLALHLPYYVIAAFWFAVVLKCRSGFRFRIMDLALITSILAFSIVLIRVRVALPLVVFLNLVTVALLVILFVGAVGRLWRASNPLWPLVLDLDSVARKKEPRARLPGARD